ncbi:MAG: hypothetical protein Q9227_009562 [Pyrenula ochraceoflavens]
MLSPSSPQKPLLSPTKAAHHQTTSRLWSYVASRLTTLYHPHSVPHFERNDATLHALLDILRANEAADEVAGLWIDGVEGEADALKAARERAGEGEVENWVMSGLAAAEEGREACEEVAAAAAELAIPVPAPAPPDLGVQIGEQILALLRRESELRARIAEVDRLTTEVEDEKSRVQEQVDDLTRLAAEKDEQFDAQTRQIGDWQRTTKMLGLKLTEYRDRLAGLERSGYHGPTIAEMKERERKVGVLQERVRREEKSLMEFGGLPPDWGAARGELERAEGEVGELRGWRDEGFEKMGRGEG